MTLIREEIVAWTGSQKLALRPWETNPYRLIDWWNMRKFSAHTYFSLGRVLEALHTIEIKNPDAPMGKDNPIRKWLPDLKTRCDSIGLRLSSKLVERTIIELAGDKTTMVEWKAKIPEIQGRIQDEMEQNLFMFVPPERASFYDKPNLLGEEVTKKLPALQYDIVEAGNCYASGRSTAVVFHLMRIMETGVQELGKVLGVGLVAEKNWQNILDEINKAIKVMIPKDPKTITLSEVSANLYAVKLAWRNEVMHPKDTYTLEEADNLIRQVKIFMEQLVQVI